MPIIQFGDIRFGQLTISWSAISGKNIPFKILVRSKLVGPSSFYFMEKPYLEFCFDMRSPNHVENCFNARFAYYAINWEFPETLEINMYFPILLHSLFSPKWYENWKINVDIQSKDKFLNLFIFDKSPRKSHKWVGFSMTSSKGFLPKSRSRD